MASLGKLLLVAGLVIAAAGLLLLLSGRFPWIGKLPGDIVIRRENFTFYFPIVTCIVLSLVVSLILWIFRR